MIDATAAFETAYKNWLLHQNLHETPAAAPNCVIIDSANSLRGAIVRPFGKLRLYIDSCDAQHLAIDELMYLSAPEDYQITISSVCGTYVCWMQHVLDASDICHLHNSICHLCNRIKHNLRNVRAAGYIWMLTNITPDIKRLIAQWLSQLGVPL